MYKLTTNLCARVCGARTRMNVYVYLIINDLCEYADDTGVLISP